MCMPSLRAHIRRHKHIWATDVLIILVFVFIFAAGSLWQPRLPSKDAMADWVAQVGPRGPIVLIVLIILETIVAPLPGAFISVAAGAVFGVWPGLLYVWIGNVIGSSLSFGIARGWGKPLVQKLIKPETIAAYEFFLSHNRLLLWAIYVLPIFPVDMIGYVIGLSAIPYRRYIKIVVIGFAVNLFILTSFGSRLFDPDGGLRWTYVFAVMVILLLTVTVEKILHDRRRLPETHSPTSASAN